LKLALVDRDLYGKIGDRGYARLLHTLQVTADPRDWLRRYYGSGRLRLIAYPLVHRLLRNKAELVAGCKDGCDCTWCRCQHALRQGKEPAQECGVQEDCER